MLRRYDFLMRFGALTLVLSLAMALVLSRSLASYQVQQETRHSMYDSFGRVSAAFTSIIAQAGLHGRISDAEYNKMSAVAVDLPNYDGNLVQNGIRIYRLDGIALYPRDVPPEPGPVTAAVKKQDIWVGPSRMQNGDEVFTAFEPFSNPNGPGFAAVIGVDFSQGQLLAASANTQHFIFIVTWGACAVIFLSLLALAMAAQRELNRRQRLADETFTQTMTGIASIVDKRDPYTAGHSKRVAEYAVKCAQRLGLKEALVRTIEASALLHDVGKIGIPDAVLLKPAKLDENERAIIGLHPEIASEILGGIEAMCDIVPCILHHHERWDGRGYPRKLAGTAIPLGARVIAVADTYDAMTTDRPYRRALSIEQTREELLRGAGVQWDVECVNAFVALIDAGHVPPPPPASDQELEILAKSFGQQVAL